MKRAWMAAGVLALALPWAVDAQTPPVPAARTLSIATLAPAGSTWMTVLNAWNRELRRRTQARLALRFYPGGVQGDEAEVVRKMRSGRIDGAAVTAVGLSMIHRPTLAFQMPGLFDSYEALDRARTAMRPELDAAYLAAGFVLVGWGDAGNDRIFATRAIRTPEELAGTHPFLWHDDALSPALFEEIHAHPVSLQVPEVLTSLQTHQIDSLLVSPLAVASLQWAPHVSHMYDLSMGMEIGALVLAGRQVASLPEGDRAILRETAAQYCQLLVHNVRRDDDGAIAPMRQRGMSVESPTPAERARWETVFAHTRARLVGTIADAAFVQRIQTTAQAH